MDVRSLSQNFVDGFLNVGIKVYGIYDMDVGIFLGNSVQSITNIDESLAEIFPTMARDQNKPRSIGCRNWKEWKVLIQNGHDARLFFRIGANFFEYKKKGVDDCVPRDCDEFFGDIFR